MTHQRTPFDSIEGSLEYVGLLREAVQEAKDSVGEEAARAGSEEAVRRLEALRLVTYKLDRLGGHVDATHRLLQDLRTLRRLLRGERQSVDEAPAFLARELSKKQKIDAAGRQTHA